MLDWLKAILGDAHTEDIEKKIETEIGKNFVARADFNTLNKTKKELDAKLAEYEDLNVDNLRGEITRLKDENETMQQRHAEELKTYELRSKLRAKLSDVAYDPDDVINLLDLSKIKTDENGKITSDVDEMVKPIRESKAHYFKQITETRQGTGDLNGGAHQGENGTFSAEQLENMSMPEYREYREKAGFPKA